jgi:putative addiction module CopG family antidote
MRKTQQLSITLPNDIANAVKSKVTSGEYATESEVIRDGLGLLLARDRRYTLAGLLSECDFSKPMSAEAREWIDAGSVGLEEI